MPSNTQTTILIIEPQSQLTKPYSYLKNKYQLTKVQNLKQALKLLNKENFSLVMLSTSFSNSKTLFFLESFKNLSTHSLIPLIYVVNLNEAISSILGTSWGGRIDILHSYSSSKQTLLSVDRLLSA